MQRDHLIAIILAVAGVSAGLSLMVAPQYLHLSGKAITDTFWGGVALTTVLIVAAGVVALRGEAKPVQETRMTPADVSYNFALVAVGASLVAALKGSPRSAWIACALAFLGVTCDYAFGPPRGFLWQKPKELTGPDFLRDELQGKPLGWSRLYINNTVYSPTAKPINITDLTIMGGNLGEKEVKLEDAYFLSGIDGTRLGAKVGWGGTQDTPQELNPVPPGAFLFVLSDPVGPPGVGLSQDDFLNKWAIVIFVATYDGGEHQFTFGQTEVKSFLPKPLEPSPHISPVKPH